MMNRYRMMTFAAWSMVLLAIGAPLARGQGMDTTTSPPISAMDSAFARARALVVSGQTAAGRAIVDSIFAATPVGTVAYGDALYGRAMIAPTAEDAARDYQQIVVEYPLSMHAGDALLQLAQLERSEGDRASAIRHLQRFLRENPGNAKRARTGLWLAQLLFEENDDVRACGVLQQARAETSPDNVELQNQMNFYGSRCDAAAARAQADSAARADSVRADSVARAEAARKARARAARPPAASTPPPPPPPPAGRPRATDANGRYSVQVGAFATEAEARKLVDRLKTRGITARVDGVRKPFRVRIGHYQSHAEASDALTRFKKLGLDGFVTSANEP